MAAFKAAAGQPSVVFNLSDVLRDDDKCWSLLESSGRAVPSLANGRMVDPIELTSCPVWRVGWGGRGGERRSHPPRLFCLRRVNGLITAAAAAHYAISGRMQLGSRYWQ